MPKLHPSDSSEQRHAETVILEILNDTLNISLITSGAINLNGVSIEPDAYSIDPPIICEIYSHIGKLNPAQQNKIQNDILKMLLADKKLNKVHRKLIAVCDETVYNQLHNNSWKSEIIRSFDIEVVLIDIPSDIKNQIVAAQKRQYR